MKPTDNFKVQVLNLKPKVPKPAARTSSLTKHLSPPAKEKAVTLGQLIREYGNEEGRRRWEAIQAVLEGRQPAPAPTPAPVPARQKSPVRAAVRLFPLSFSHVLIVRQSYERPPSPEEHSAPPSSINSLFARINKGEL